MPVWTWLLIVAAGLLVIGKVFSAMMHGAQAASGRGCIVILMVLALGVFLVLMLLFGSGLVGAMALMEQAGYEEVTGPPAGENAQCVWVILLLLGLGALAWVVTGPAVSNGSG